MSSKEIIREYQTEDITVYWKPGKCIHAGICVKKLPNVYKPNNKPWISIENAQTNELVEQIDSCPSGALSYSYNKENSTSNKKENIMKEKKIAGRSPMMVDLESGKAYAWCACGHSSNQPWCDGSHKGSGISPVIIKPESNSKAAMCMCKKSSNSPHCDGSHAKIE